MTRRLTITITGDSLVTRRIPDYDDPAFSGLVDLLRGCDAAFTNVEVTLSHFRGSPVVESGGMALSTDPRSAHDLRRMGFNLAAFANNHTLNYGEEGVLRTLEAVREAGIVCAGAGANRGEARLPAYLETKHGRVGLIGCASTFAPGHRAGDQTAYLTGRAGLNPLRYKTTILVDAAAMRELQRIAEVTGIEEQRRYRDWMGFGHPTKEGEFSFLDRTYAVTDGEMRIETEPHEQDMAEIVRWVEEAKRQAGFAMVSIHAHEQGRERWLPAGFLPTFAHAVIDAGADLFVAHGPHLLRGMEIYRGKPVFYSIGNFLFQYETMERVGADDFDNLHVPPSWTPGQVMHHLHGNLERSFPADERYWETVLPILVYEGDALQEITLHPVSLGFQQPVWERGVPRLASGEAGERILQRFADLSQPFGTCIEIGGGAGRITLPA